MLLFPARVKSFVFLEELTGKLPDFTSTTWIHNKTKTFDPFTSKTLPLTWIIVWRPLRSGWQNSSRLRFVSVLGPCLLYNLVLETSVLLVSPEKQVWKWWCKTVNCSETITEVEWEKKRVKKKRVVRYQSGCWLILHQLAYLFQLCKTNTYTHIEITHSLHAEGSLALVLAY